MWVVLNHSTGRVTSRKFFHYVLALGVPTYIGQKKIHGVYYEDEKVAQDAFWFFLDIVDYQDKF